MSEKRNPILKRPFALRRAGDRFRLRRAGGVLFSTSAVCVPVFASAAGSGATTPEATPAQDAAAAQTIVRSPVAKPIGAGECHEAWSMSRVHAGTVWVGDSATGRISVYRLDGRRLRVIDTQLGRDRLTGFTVGADGLSVVDGQDGQVIQLPGART